MKQAQTDADELIAAYRLEQQDAFDKAASASGKSRLKSSTELFSEHSYSNSVPPILP